MERETERTASGGQTSTASIAVTSVKGGVGKTTLALNTSYALARRGWRTLLIDTDPQGGLGLSLRGDLRHRVGLAEAARGDVPVTEAIRTTRLPNFDLLPVGSVPAFEAAGWSARLADGSVVAALLQTLEARYDVVVFDTAPGLSGSAMGALRCASHVLVPLQAEPLAARTAQPLIEAIGSLRQERGRPQLLGIVLTMLQTRVEPSLGVAQESWGLFPENVVFDASVPRDPIFLQASADGVPVALVQRRPPAVAAVFDQIAGEIEERLGWHEDGHGQGLALLD